MATPRPRADEAGDKRAGCALTAILMLPLILLTGFCSYLGQPTAGTAPAAPAEAGPDHLTLELAAKTLVRDKLRDPGSAEFSDIVVHAGDGHTSSIVCGKVNAKNGFGGMAGAQRFIVGGTTVFETEISQEDFEQLWVRYC